MNKTDKQLQQDVEAELRFDPKVNSAKIGVTVEKGAVSLTGTIDTWAEKWAAEVATKRVCGVRTVAQDLKVKLLGDHKQSDGDIAAAVLGALKWDVLVPSTVTAKVENGMVTLEGKVTRNYQRESAERAVRYLMGVTYVNNSISLSPDVSPTEVKTQVEAALHRQATHDAKSIHVATSAGKVTLTGHASSWTMIDDAARAAWAAPGVTDVANQMTVSIVQ